MPVMRTAIVRRLPQTLIVLALLAATAAAFAVTERLKLEKSPITGTRVDKVFSPVCECARDIAEISFRLRGGQVVTVDMLDSNGRPVRTLVRNKRERAGRVTYVWDGRDDAGRVVPEGIYRPRVRLRRHGRTIVLPNPIRVDTRAPKITLTRVFPRMFSPDGDGNADRVTAEYEIDEPARAMMLVNGRRRVLSKFRETEGRLVWFGRIGGVPVRSGDYEIRLRAFDRAGNRSVRTRAVTVRVRYVELVPDRVEAVAGRRFGIGVATDADAYRWLFDGRRGKYRKPVLVLRAPDEPGTYVLYVVVGRWADRAEIAVAEAPQP
jgi:FlgD Ig-like domain